MDERLKLIDLLYATVSEVELWQDVLKQIASMTGVSKGIIMLRDKATAELRITNDIHIELASPMLFGLSSQEIESYISHFYKLDPWTDIERDNHPYRPYAMSSYLPIENLKKLTFWEWLEPQGISDSIVLEIHASADSWVSLNLFFDGSQTSVKQETLELLRSIQDILAKVWKYGLNMRASTAPSESHAYYLEQQQFPSLLLDRHSTVVYQNRKATELMTNASFPVRIKDEAVFIKDRKILSNFRTQILGLSSTPHSIFEPAVCKIDLKGFFCKCTLLGKSEDIIGADSALRLVTIRVADASVMDHPSYVIWDDPSLTRRERELVKVLADGGKVVDFMHSYGIAKSTAHAHWSNVKTKLKVSDRSKIYAHHQLYLKHKTRYV